MEQVLQEQVNSSVIYELIRFKAGIRKTLGLKLATRSLFVGPYKILKDTFARELFMAMLLWPNGN